jgi:hypothetical protein
MYMYIFLWVGRGSGDFEFFERPNYFNLKVTVHNRVASILQISSPWQIVSARKMSMPMSHRSKCMYYYVDLSSTSLKDSLNTVL